MPTSKLKTGDILTFDPLTYPFDGLFLEKIRKKFPEASSLQGLADLHSLLPCVELGKIYSCLYQSLREATASTLYRRLLREEISKFLKEPFYFQRVPTIRIHPPGARSVHYHTDYWYGHGPEVLNFWIPLTPAFSTNSIFTADDQDSLRLTSLLEQECLDQTEMDKRLRGICSPVTADTGTCYVFHSRTVHGTEENHTLRTRVSIDFRILPHGKDPGTKNIDEYYCKSSRIEDPIGLEFPAKKLRVGSYIFPKYGFARFISTFNQRAVILAYADRCNLEVVLEETELFNVAHHPILMNLASGHGTQDFDGVLLFSVLCLPEDPEIRRKIYEASENSGKFLFFANENLRFPEGSSIEDIEKRRQVLRHP